MADVQRAGRVGRDELDQYFLAIARRAAVGVGLAGHCLYHRLPGSWGEAEIDEARAGDLGILDQFARLRLRHQRIDDALGQLARVAARRLGQLHGHVGGDIAVRRDLGALELDLGLRLGQALRDGGLDQGNQLFLLLEEHGQSAEW